MSYQKCLSTKYYYYNIKMKLKKKNKRIQTGFIWLRTHTSCRLL
jgi:hypothetical protein